MREIAESLELRAQLRLIVELVKQSEFFFDRGTRFEQTIARKMLVEKTLEAEALLDRIDTRDMKA